MFGGSTYLDNLVPQAKDINRSGEWKKMEEEWRDALKDGKSVSDVEIKIEYSGESQRPTRFIVNYKIDGIPLDEPTKIENLPFEKGT